MRFSAYRARVVPCRASGVEGEVEHVVWRHVGQQNIHAGWYLGPLALQLCSSAAKALVSAVIWNKGRGREGRSHMQCVGFHQRDRDHPQASSHGEVLSLEKLNIVDKMRSIVAIQKRKV